MQYVPTITNHTQVWWVPNVVVVHEKEGIEVVHLASGRTICKVYMICPFNFILLLIQYNRTVYHL
jgi:hypothetical protein